MKTIEVAPSARKELSATVEWYEARSQGLGVRFFEVVDEAFTSIAHAPAGFPVWEQDERVRKFVLDRFPYVIFYRELVHSIEVVAVAHTARKPGYWIEQT